MGFRFAFLLSIAAAAPAAAENAFVTRSKVEPARFGQLVAVLGEEMRTGGRFAWVTPDERARVDASLARMAALLAGKRTLDELGERERVALLNAQEEVNAILTKRDAERLVCERRTLPGSHRKISSCETYGERMARIKGSREQVDRLNRRVQQCRELTVPGTAANAGNAGITCRSG